MRHPFSYAGIPDDVVIRASEKSVCIHSLLHGSCSCRVRTSRHRESWETVYAGKSWNPGVVVQIELRNVPRRVPAYFYLYPGTHVLLKDCYKPAHALESGDFLEGGAVVGRCAILVADSSFYYLKSRRKVFVNVGPLYVGTVRTSI